MIKKIKVKKQLRLDELIKYVWDNELNPIVCFKDGGGRASVIFGHAGSIGFGEYSYGTFHKNDTFTVEVEEEITKNTPFGWLIEVNKSGVIEETDCSISDMEDNESIRMYALIDKKLELVWEADSDEL